MVDQATPARTAEVERWLEQRQSSLQVTRTTTTPGGHVLDWVPIQSQTAAAIAEPPPAVVPAARADGTRADLPRPTTPPRFDTGEAGPPGHVPILRPDLTRIRSLDDLSKKGSLRVNKNRPNRTSADPNPAGYFHASSSQSTTIYGTEAWLNLWDPAVDIPSSPGDDHSISQLWLQNYQETQTQSIEGGLTVDNGLNGDGANHLFTYYTTNGYTQDGNNLGGYNRLYSGWVQVDPSIFPGIAMNGTSEQGGSQLEIGVKYQLWQGNWWFGFNTDETGPWTWLGYYPGSLFGSGIADEVQWVGWGGEVYSALANPCATTDQMGSGRQAADGWTYACYQRLIQNQTDLNGTLADFDGTGEVDVAASGCDTNEYTINTFMNSGGSWGSYQYFGGPAA
jgi:hypothetical protein